MLPLWFNRIHRETVAEIDVLAARVPGEAKELAAATLIALGQVMTAMAAIMPMILAIVAPMYVSVHAMP